MSVFYEISEYLDWSVSDNFSGTSMRLQYVNDKHTNQTISAAMRIDIDMIQNKKKLNWIIVQVCENSKYSKAQY